MIVNDENKFGLDYFPINKNNSEEPETEEKICSSILNNFKDHSKEENNLYDLTKWDEYKDNILKQLVLFYNFDFKKISQVFDKLCKIKREINEDGEEIIIYTEKILRYHWSFIHSRRFFGNKTGEEFYILNNDENKEKNNKENIKGEKGEIEVEKNLVNTININSLNKEKDLDSYFDKLLNQKMDKERTKIFEMELKENEKNSNLFPINSEDKNQEKNVNEIIKDIKEKESQKEKIKNKKKEEIEDNE